MGNAEAEEIPRHWVYSSPAIAGNRKKRNRLGRCFPATIAEKKIRLINEQIFALTFFSGLKCISMETSHFPSFLKI